MHAWESGGGGGGGQVLAPVVLSEKRPDPQDGEKRFDWAWVFGDTNICLYPYTKNK